MRAYATRSEAAAAAREERGELDLATVAYLDRCDLAVAREGRRMALAECARLRARIATLEAALAPVEPRLRLVGGGR